MQNNSEEYVCLFSPL